MKALRGWAISAGLVFAATAAYAQGAPQQAGTPYQAASDSEPYTEAPPPPPASVPPQAAVPEYGPGVPPGLLPPTEVYAVLRENGFAPLGVPRLRGLFYSIAAVNRRGDDGRLVIDARNGQIVRFAPVYHYGFYDGPPWRYAPLSPMMRYDGPRPPAAIPRMASHVPPSVPVPRSSPAKSSPAKSSSAKSSPVRPSEERPLAEKPAQQSAAVQTKPAEPPQVAAPALAPEAKPAAPVIQPTQPMPQVQDLE